MTRPQAVARFLSGSGGNALLAWAVFALLWPLLDGRCSLWAISALAHLAATTQVFLLARRHPGSFDARQPVWLQFIKFQIAFFMHWAVGALMLNALYAQGVSPLLGQAAAVCLLSAGGQLLGRPFPADLAMLDGRALFGRVADFLKRERVSLLVLAVTLVLFEYVWGARFYDRTPIGHDFSLTGIGLLEGKYWIDSNGLIGGLFNPPWFTPAWCAGAAYYADPQTGFYSPLQALTLLVDPFTATHLNTLLFAAVAFLGSYAVARVNLRWSTAAAVVFATLGMVNTFLPLRSAVGEAGYQPFYLWTILLLALCWPSASLRGRALIWPPLVVALTLTAWLQFGFGGMMVPVFLGTMLLCLVLTLFGRAELPQVILRAAAGGSLAIVINSAKIYTSASLMANFPRDFYALPGFPALGDALRSIALGLFAPSQWTADFGMRRLADIEFLILPHEWAMNFGFGALVMALLAAVALRGRHAAVHGDAETATKAAVTHPFYRWAAISGSVILCLIPPLLLWHNGLLRDVLKQIPILGSAAWPMRWIVIYIPLFQVLLALPVKRVLEAVSAWRAAWLTVAALALVWLGPLTEPVDYYLDRDMQAYKPGPVIAAFENSRKGSPVPIDRVTLEVEQYGDRSRNDAMLQGASQADCYNPIYGYRLESFPQAQRVQVGPALKVDRNGQSLIFNPACLVHPLENACNPGDGFRMSDPVERAKAENFLARKPFEWKRPLAGSLLAWISQICFWVLLTLVLSKAWQMLLQAARPLSQPGELRN